MEREEAVNILKNLSEIKSCSLKTVPAATVVAATAAATVATFSSRAVRAGHRPSEENEHPARLPKHVGQEVPAANT